MEQKIKIKLSEFISFQIEKRQFPSHCDSDNGLKGKFMQLHMKLRGHVPLTNPILGRFGYGRERSLG